MAYKTLKKNIFSYLAGAYRDEQKDRKRWPFSLQAGQAKGRNWGGEQRTCQLHQLLSLYFGFSIILFFFELQLLYIGNLMLFF